MKKLFLYLFIFLSFFTFRSYSATCTCDGTWDLIQTDTSIFVLHNNGTGVAVGATPTPPSSTETLCVSDTSYAFDIFTHVETSRIHYSAYDVVAYDRFKTREHYSCTPTPPSCPDGQHNDSTDIETLHCACDSGYPTYDSITGDITECVQPTCPLVSPDNNLPLKMENVTYTSCRSLFNPVLGYSMDFVTDPVSGLTCCYSDSIKDSNPDDCPVNQIKNNDGLCVDIPDVTEDCQLEYYWSIIEKKCLPIYPDENATSDDNQSSSDDGLNGDGTQRDSNDDSTYNGGGFEDNTTDKVLLEYNNDEVNDMLAKYKNTVTKSFTDYLVSASNEFITLYKISLPAMPNCGCTNPTYDMVLLNKRYADTIDICSPMSDLLAILKPILWFFFLVGMLFNFFMGRN